jgi:hypothetical protein
MELEPVFCTLYILKKRLVLDADLLRLSDKQNSKRSSCNHPSVHYSSFIILFVCPAKNYTFKYKVSLNIAPVYIIYQFVVLALIFFTYVWTLRVPPVDKVSETEFIGTSWNKITTKRINVALSSRGRFHFFLYSMIQYNQPPLPLPYKRHQFQNLFRSTIFSAFSAS